ncbi:MAG: FKBP-type peptidyl-prolyl cis-trans isomerase [bacterium]|nr:FKBP-type peptidyl-prolyl cis-trans isomerase [bacterium]
MRKFGTREWIAAAVGVVVAITLFYGNSIWNYFARGTGPIGPTNQSSNSIQPSANQQTMNNISTIPGLEIYDETVGTGTVASSGNAVTVHYVGILTNGEKFDSSLDRGQPFTFALGAGQVIRGWDLGVEGMKVGGVRRLVIPANLAYGDRAIGSIPAGSTLIFQVQLLGVE